MNELFNLKIYVPALLAASAVVLFYYRMATLQWTENERRALLQEQMALSVILSVLNGADGRHLISDPQARRNLFFRYSKSMKEDVLELVRLYDLSLLTVAYVLIFFAFYFALRTKALLACGARDLAFLAGLELAIFRGLKN